MISIGKNRPSQEEQEKKRKRDEERKAILQSQRSPLANINPNAAAWTNLSPFSSQYRSYCRQQAASKSVSRGIQNDVVVGVFSGKIRLEDVSQCHFHNNVRINSWHE
jgi:hypothetical protein